MLWEKVKAKTYYVLVGDLSGVNLDESSWNEMNLQSRRVCRELRPAQLENSSQLKLKEISTIPTDTKLRVQPMVLVSPPSHDISTCGINIMYGLRLLRMGS